jgi:hypothetical protein
MYAGLGIAPQVVAAVVSLGAKILPTLFRSESGELERAARAGNVVAWWRLKALAGNQVGGDLLPVSGIVNGRAVTVPILTPEQREGLIVAAGVTADQPHHLFGPTGPTTAPGVIERLLKLMADGTGGRLEQQSASVLAAQGSSAAAPAVGNLGPLLVIAGVGIAALALLRR